MLQRIHFPPFASSPEDWHGGMPWANASRAVCRPVEAPAEQTGWHHLRLSIAQAVVPTYANPRPFLPYEYVTLKKQVRPQSALLSG